MCVYTVLTVEQVQNKFNCFWSVFIAFWSKWNFEVIANTHTKLRWTKPLSRRFSQSSQNTWVFLCIHPLALFLALLNSVLASWWPTRLTTRFWNPSRMGENCTTATEAENLVTCIRSLTYTQTIWTLNSSYMLSLPQGYSVSRCSQGPGVITGSANIKHYSTMHGSRAGWYIYFLS